MKNHDSDPGAAWSRLTVPILLITTAAVVAASCSTRRVDEEPVIDQGDRVPPASDTVRPGTASPDGSADRAAALADCTGQVCDALARGELALGMNETQVLAATHSGESAWQVRRSGDVVIMSPADMARPPDDAVAPVAWVQIRDGDVIRYAYNEAQGVRLVSNPADTTLEGRAEARGRALLEEGDRLAAAGDLDRALNRYDRADILLRDDPMVTYRIATTLDKQLRPIQALLQYKLFLHRLELEKIRARGEVAANIAEAIARARERIIVLEKRGG